MSEDEKMAIDYLQAHIIPYLKNGNIKFLVNEVILNLIEEQKQEIEKQEKLFKEHLKSDERREKTFFKQLSKYKREIELKDKIIDEMAKAIDDYDVSFHINHYKNIEHVKKVFTNKIKEN